MAISSPTRETRAASTPRAPSPSATPRMRGRLSWPGPRPERRGSCRSGLARPGPARWAGARARAAAGAARVVPFRLGAPGPGELGVADGALVDRAFGDDVVLAAVADVR